MRQWFILNTLTGKEDKVIDAIRLQAQLADPALTPYIGELLAPEQMETRERKVRVKGGDASQFVTKRMKVAKKRFPSYVFAELELYWGDDPIPSIENLNRELWDFLVTHHAISGLIGILGAQRDRAGRLLSHPHPMTVTELAKIKGETIIPEKKSAIDFDVGDRVVIVEDNSGFKGLVGTVQKVDAATETVQLTAAVFGQETTMSLKTWQVAKYVPSAKDAAAEE